jgi:hypothetical protein
MRIGLSIFFALAAAGNAYADDPLDQAAIAQAKAQDANAVQVGNLYRGSGEKADYQVPLEAGKCYWFSGASEGLTKLYMYLWKPSSGAFTPHVADLRSPGQGTMAYCTQETGRYKFQVKTEGKKGHFVVAVFAKQAK